jgi:hypothetical protein
LALVENIYVNLPRPVYLSPETLDNGESVWKFPTH